VGAVIAVGRGWAYLKARKRFWLSPALVAFCLVVALLLLSSGSTIVPIWYRLF
jgi:Family of unknown function (DUF5989)